MRFLLMALFLATPVFAQSIDPRYQQVGSFEGTFGETALGLVSLFDTEKDRTMIKLRDNSGFDVFGIDVRAIGEDGIPTSPIASFTIGPIGAGGGDIKMDVFLSDSTGYYQTDNDIGGRVILSDFTRDETTLSFSFEAELQPIKQGSEGFEVDDTRAAQAISGNFSGTFTDID